MKRAFAVLAVILAALPASAAPTLLVVISVDQMRADYLDRFAADFTGGFKRLREQGAVFSDAEHVHVPTETGPGHAAILTGRFPAETGIVGNTWWDREASTETYCVADSMFGLGPEHLRAYTLGDAMKAKDPAARVVSVSLKDRAAILLGGKKADAAIWYDKGTGAFTTSSYYARPKWLAAFNADLHAKGGDLAGFSAAADAELIYTPKADRITLELAEEALKRFKLGRRETDLLAVGFSATDYIGHRYGPDGPQMREQMLSLDVELGELFAELDKRVGKGRWDLALTADHGVTPRPEDPSGKAQGVVRVMFDELGERLEKTLQYQFPSSERWLVNEYPNFYLNRALAANRGLDWPVFVRQAARIMEGAEGVAKVYVAADIDPADPFADVYRRSVALDRSGDLLVRVKEGVLVTDRPTGADHGAPYLNDRRVAMIFLGPDFKPGRHDERAWVADLAPTLASLLGVNLPPAPGARVHDEIFVRP